MCSWCYAFKPVLQQLRQQLAELYRNKFTLVTILGGLAADSDRPMPEAMRQQLRATWQRIEDKLPATQFNYNFWDNWQETQPRRSTYPACRAIIAAHSFDKAGSTYYEQLMLDGIQAAYYQQALNPSNDKLLGHIAAQIGLVMDDFAQQFFSAEIQQALIQQIEQSQQMNVHSYPSLILQTDSSSYWPISIDYHSSATIIDNMNELADFN